MRDRPSPERVRDLITYDPDLGAFFARRSALGTRKGDIVGSVDAEGYRRISIDGYSCRAAKIAWVCMTGEWPTAYVDHRDCDPRNDRWSNLRAADRSQNMVNRRWRNASGFRGVHRNGRRWMAIITWRGERHYLGQFDSAETAAAAYAAKAAELHGEFARTDGGLRCG